MNIPTPFLFAITGYPSLGHSHEEKLRMRDSASIDAMVDSLLVHAFDQLSGFFPGKFSPGELGGYLPHSWNSGRQERFGRESRDGYAKKRTRWFFGY